MSNPYERAIKGLQPISTPPESHNGFLLAALPSSKGQSDGPTEEREGDLKSLSVY